MKELNCLVFLSCVSVLTVSEQSNVTGSDKPIHVTVGHDVILPCHLVPQYDVTALTVEWKRNESYVCVYTSRAYKKEGQDEKFRGRTSLFIDELVKGNISLKLINVTEQDAGNYTCFVPKLDSQVRRRFINLIVEPPRERTKGKQTNNPSRDTGPPPMNGDVVITVITAVTAILVGFGIILFSLLWPIFRGQDVGRPQGQNGVDEHEMVQRAGNVQPDLCAGQDGGGPEEE